jgi:hypothetical protein
MELAETPRVTVLCNYQKDVKSVLQSRRLLWGKMKQFSSYFLYICTYSLSLGILMVDPPPYTHTHTWNTLKRWIVEVCRFYLIMALKKVKFSLSIPWRHVRGSGCIARLILNLCILQLPYLQESTVIPNELEAGWATEVVWLFSRSEKSLACTGKPTPDSSACNLDTIPAMLPHI